MRRFRADRVRSSVAWVTVAALVCSLTVVVFRADGVVGSSAVINDGGAWLVNRARGAVGHVNQASAEVSSRVSVGVAGSVLDVAQAEGVIAVHDASLRKLLLVDDRLGTTDGGSVLPVGSTVAAVDHGVVVWTTNPLALWAFHGDALDDITGRNVAEVEPDIIGEGQGAAAVAQSGVVVTVDAVSDTMIVLDARGRRTVVNSIGLESDGRFDLTMVGDQPVLVDGTRIGRLDRNRLIWQPLTGGGTAQITLQQPGAPAAEVVGVDADGTLVRIDIEGGEVDSFASTASTGALRPVVSHGCVHAAFTAPARYVRTCDDDDENQDLSLDGYTTSLRLREVNGWIWLNDVANGLAMVAGERGVPQAVGDWVSAFEDEELVETIVGGGDGLVGGARNASERTNTDASGSELGSDDDFDGDDDNLDPFARDDAAVTREGRPVVVPVLVNDEDPDGDVLLVSAAGSETEAGVVVTPDGSAVQVTPPSGFRGVIEAAYTVTDGRGGEDTATIEVDVADVDGSNNQPPVTVGDVVAARPGTPATINLLDNDFDPEGDTLVLLSVRGEGAAFAFTFDGRLTVTPDASSVDDEFELEYTAADEFGATTPGTVVVKVQPEGVNNRPDARNDSAVVALGGRVILNVLGNDADPDGDTLVVAVRPALVSGEPTGAASLRVSPDGELFFVPTVAGTYVWTYAATDGQASDIAQIRIDVRAHGENRPPVAIRDDVVIPRGGSRIVPVLANDGDPDGDVLGIVGNMVDPSSGLSVELIPDVGFRVSVGAESPSRPQFVYQVSDGLSAPVSAVVVVAVVDGVGADQPPVLQSDVVDVRAGGTVQARLLLNDFDPEGEALQIVRVSSRPGATMTINPDGITVQISVPSTTRQSFTFVYDAADVAGNQSATTVRVRVLRADSPNRPPIARPDTVSVRADGLAEIDVLANDSDPDGDALRVDGIARQPEHGTATLSAQTGAVVYTPNLDFRGTDTFEYLLVDTPGGSQIGEIRVGVMPAPTQNQPPQAVDDIGFEAVAGGAAINIPVTANDSDPEGDVLSVVEVSAPQVGSVSLSSQLGSVVYVPPPSGLGFSETRFTYTITDGAGNTASANVQVLIVEAPDDQDDPVPPEAIDDVIGPVREGDEVVVSVLDNDRDPDGSVSELRVSAAGGVEVVGSRVRIVAPDSTTEYRYTITDPDGLADTATITVLVTPNSSPVTVPIEVSTNYETPITVDLAPGASDPDGDTIEFSCCQSVQRGRADVLSAGVGGGRVEFRPDDGFSGVASFAYQVDDREGHQVTGLVRITVRSLVNRSPVAGDVSLELEAGRLQPLDLTNFASDPDADDVLVFTVGPTANDRVSVFGSGAALTLSIPINAGENDDDRFVYTVTDRNGAVASGTVVVDVVPTTVPPPLAAADTASALAGVPVEIPVVQNDSGQGLVVVSVSGAVGGSVEISGAGSVTFTPAGGREGAPATFTYQVVDVADRTASGTVTVTVTDVPAQPSPPITTAEGSQTCSVTWATPANHGGVISGYVLEGDDGRIVNVGLTNAVVLDDLVDGVSYRFRVTASNVAGSSPVSDWSAPCTPDIVPGRPGVPSVAFGTGALTATWSPPAVAQGSAILRYALELGGAGNATTTIPAPGGSGAISYEWVGLTNGEAYQFRVRAENSLGFGGWSDWSSTVTPCAAPSAPAQPTVTRGDESFAVAWTVPAVTGGCPPVEYEVERDPGATILSTSATSLAVSGLATGSTYRFRVRARNMAGWSGWSVWSSDLAFCGTPGSPTTPVFQYDRLAATGYSSGSLDLTWGAAATNGGCPTLSYDVQIVATGQIRSTGVLPSDAAPFRYTGLTNGTPYAFQVRAVNAIGAGPWSSPSALETPFGPPVCSSGLISATNLAVGQVQVTSSFTCNANGSPAGLWYRVSTNGGPFVDFTSGQVFGGLAAATLYRFEVSVFNSSWVPTGTSLGSGQVVTWGSPDQVTGLVCSAGNAAGTCSWAVPGANGSVITGYDVELSPGSTVTGHTSTSISFSGLANGVSHSARVRACNSVGCGSWSTAATFTPTQPLSVSISRGGSAEGVGGCATPACSFITVTLGGPWVAPYAMVCFVAGGATPADILFSGSTSAPSDLCLTDRGSEGVTVTLDGITSNTIFW